MVLKVIGEYQRLFDDVFVDIEGILSLLTKRYVPAHEFVETDPNRPQIHQMVVPLPAYDFWSHVVWSPDDRKGTWNQASAVLHHFGGSHIDQFQVAVFIHHKVFRLDVSVDDVVLMEVLQDTDEISHEKLGITGAQETYKNEH